MNEVLARVLDADSGVDSWKGYARVEGIRKGRGHASERRRALWAGGGAIGVQDAAQK